MSIVATKAINDSAEKSYTVNPRYTQYLVRADQFIPCGPTTPKLEPGMYFPVCLPGETYLQYHQNITDDLVITPDSKTEEIVKEINDFWNKKDLFKKFGLTHKRGILLHGIPGSGKTTTVCLVMNEIIKRGGVGLVAKDPWSATSCLHFMREIDPDMPILLILEDIDSLIKSHGESQVLSLLDGEDSIDNLVTIATTNYPEELAGRITNRPSRFDRVIEIGMPNWDARMAYLKSRKLNLTNAEYEEWVEATEGLGIAHLKELVVSVYVLGHSFEEILERLNDMREAPTSEPAKKMGFGTEKKKTKAGFGH